jgi:[3-methyl-2-oxobutanoate dehydrogenase (acetyl-transferring)] kinase
LPCLKYYKAKVANVQLPKRLARRLMDLQFLPYIVVTNPHIKRVYDAYHHAFNTLRSMPEVCLSVKAFS